jgi:ornithine cyclodeaminase
MLVVNADETRELFPMDAAIDAMRRALLGFHAGTAYQPLRSVVQPPGIAGLAVVKPASVAGERPALGMKIVTLFNGNAARGLDSVQGAVLLLDTETGIPQAMIEAGTLTEIRTAAVSGVATALLARADAGDVAVLGAGVQGRSHLAAMAAVRPLRRVRLWNRTRDRAEALAKECAASGFAADVEVEVVARPSDAVVGADIICTVTSSPDPVLSGTDVEAGAHINAVGAFQPATRELPTDLVARATVFVDSRESALAEAGDLLIPESEGALVAANAIAAELGAVVAGAHPGRTSEDEITLFKSVGLALEDVEAAAFVYDAARRRGVGTEVRFP